MVDLSTARAQARDATAAGSIRVAYVDWRRKRTCHVYKVSPIECTSIRIAETLRYE
jgi:hypothetical protein